MLLNRANPSTRPKLPAAVTALSTSDVCPPVPVGQWHKKYEFNKSKAS